MKRKIIPRRVFMSLKQNLEYSGINISVDRFMNLILLGSFFSAALIGAILYVFGIQYIILWAITALIFFIIVCNTYLNLKVSAKSRFVESILPDVLDLTSANLRSGMTVDSALLASAKPEFGLFKEDIYRAGEEISLGKSVSEALSGLAKRVKSDPVKKAISLIIMGHESGGKLATILHTTSINLKRRQLIEHKVKAAVVNYVAFIYIIIMLGAPFLFATATFLVESMSDLLSNIEMPAGQASLVAISGLSVSTDVILIFAVLLLLTNAIMGSFVVGEIKEGSAYEGLRNLPLIITVSLSLFFIVRFFLSSFFTI